MIGLIRTFVSRLVPPLLRARGKHGGARPSPTPWIETAHRHPDTAMSLEELGTLCPPYQRTFDYPGTRISASHGVYDQCAATDDVILELSFGRVRIEGWLQRPDALKLFELAYFSPGDVLELGSYHGLSTSILARASAESPSLNRVVTVELDPANVATTMRNLAELGLADRVAVLRGDAVTVVLRLAAEGRRFSFAFVDHCHQEEPVYEATRALAGVLDPGAFVLFHDYNDPRNRDPDDHDYGVYQGATRAAAGVGLDFYGVYGCCALFRCCP